MRFFAKRIDKYIYRAKTLNLPAIEKEFERSLNKEIDYNQELSNMQRFRENFKDDYGIYIPKGYPEYSTKKLITMEFIKGKDVKAGTYEFFDMTAIQMIKRSSLETVICNGDDPKNLIKAINGEKIGTKVISE